MPRYRKKPVVVNAYQMTNENALDYWNWPAWLQAGLTKDPMQEGAVIRREGEIRIQTLEGTQLVSPNDYIIEGIKGEIYPCKPDIFEATYEEVVE